MTQVKDYQQDSISPEQVIASKGFLLLDFGTNWCGHCIGAQPHIQSALAAYPNLQHSKEEDGPGRRLGRIFRVKLWPTLVLLKDGKEMDRVVRPTSEKAVAELLATTK